MNTNTFTKRWNMNIATATTSIINITTIRRYWRRHTHMFTGMRDYGTVTHITRIFIIGTSMEQTQSEP